MDMQILPNKPDAPTHMAQALSLAPTRILEAEIGQPLLPISVFDATTNRHYRRAKCLVRLHTQPLGVVELELEAHEMSADECAQCIWQALHAQINEHLRQDGLPEVSSLTAAGLSSPTTPRCLQEREQFLTHAPFVSVIVPTHDRPEQLAACLHSLMSLCYPHYEVIVVDNAPSTNATADFIQQAYQHVPQVRYIREDHLGTSWARNCGRMAAKGEILAFADDDIVTDSYWLTELVRGFSRTNDVVCVTGLILPLELETQPQMLFEEYGGYSKGFITRIFGLLENRLNDPLYPYTAGRFGTGGSMAFTATFLQSIDGFDQALGPGTLARAGEDLSPFFQAVTRGHKLVYEPAAIAYHPHRRDYQSLRQQVYNYGMGVAAYLTKNLLDKPELLLDFITKLPYGLYFTLSPRSPKNNKKSKYYPKELTILELQGMLYGPFAYLQSRWAMRNIPERLLEAKLPITFSLKNKKPL